MSRRTAALRRAALSGATSIAVGLAVGLTAAPAAASDAGSGSLVIRAFTSPSAAGAAFSFAVTCTGEGEPVNRTVVVPTAGGVGSATVDGIPLDMACLVEDSAPAGWRVDTINPQAAMSSAAGTPVEFLHSAPAPAALSLAKTALPDGGYGEGATAPAVLRGATVRYVITYRNTGDVLADAAIVDEIPAGTTYAGAARCAPECSVPPVFADGRVHFDVPADAGGTGTVSYDVRISDDAANGDVILAAAAAVQPGNSHSGSVTHRVSVPATGLRVESRTDKDSAPVGDVVTYTVDVANSGDAVQDSITVTDVVPPQVEFVAGSASCAAPCAAQYDASTNTVTWRVGSLASGAKSSGLQFQARIRPLTVNPDGSLPGTLVLNSAVASSARTPATVSNEVRTVVVAVLGTKVVRQRPPAGVSAPAAPAVPTLPATGSGTASRLALALALIASGGALVVGSRRRTPNSAAY